jgi:hypothetical protein
MNEGKEGSIIKRPNNKRPAKKKKKKKDKRKRKNSIIDIPIGLNFKKIYLFHKKL